MKNIESPTAEALPGFFYAWKLEGERMAKRSDARDAAREEYIARRQKGEKVNLKELAETLGISYDTLRHWKTRDKWDSQIKRKPGGQPRNKNAVGNRGGAPRGNKNAEKDGAYSAIFFNRLSEDELAIFNDAPRGAVDALKHEMGILKLREKKILDKIKEYEEMDEDTLIVNNVMDMRVPGGRGEHKQDGANQNMGMYFKDTPFARVLKLQEALYKVQGRIATVAGALRAAEESDRRAALEAQRLELMRMKVTGEVDDDGEDGDEP